MKVPVAKSVGVVPEIQPNELLVSRKVCIHCKSTSVNPALVYLTQDLGNDINGDPVEPSAAAYTHEIEAGALYEVPHEHSGRVWLAGLNGPADITITQYG